MIEAGASREGAAAVCVFLHGRGQTPELMVDHVVRRSDLPHVLFLLPAAEAGQWYEARAVDALTPRTLGQIEASLAIVDEAIARARDLAGSRPVLLAGFSQGACLAIEYAMRRGKAVDAIAAFTGCRVGLEEDERPTRGSAGIPVLMSNAPDDAWVPLDPFMEACATFARCGAELTVEVVPGRGHEVCARELAAFAALAAKAISRSASR